MATYECLRTVMAPKGHVKSYAYQPGEPIELDEERDAVLVETGYVGKTGDYQKMLKAQKQAEESGMGLTAALAEVAKLKAEIVRLREENERLLAKISKSKGSA